MRIIFNSHFGKSIIYFNINSMKHFFSVNLFVIFSIVLVGCVSKKQFLAEQTAKNKANVALADSRKQNQVLAKEKTDLTADLENLNKEKASLTTDIASLKTQLKDGETRLASTKKNADMTTEELRRKLNEKEVELANKEKALAEREKMVVDLRNAIAKKEEALQGLLDKVNKSLVGFNPDDLTVEKKNGKIYVSLSEKLLFTSGSATVQKEGKEALGKVAEVLNKNTEIDVMIEGHTDNVPIKTAVFKDNWDLSVIRATSIVRIMTEDYGVNAQRVTPAGRGEFNPVMENDSKENKAKNRRVEIILSPKLDELLKIVGGN